MPRSMLAVSAAALLVAAAPASSAPEPDVSGRLIPSLTQVEYTLRFDGGRPPRTPGWADRCPGCGRYHVQRGQEYVEEERPMEAAGYLVSPTRVVTPDMFLQDRFVESVAVRSGEASVGAAPVAHAVDHNAMMLELDAPLEGARPLEFAEEWRSPYRSAHWQKTDARWTLELKGMSLDETIIGAGGEPGVSGRYVTVPARGLVIDADGSPVGLAMDRLLDADGSWRGSPEAWAWISRAELDALRSEIEEAAGATLPRVELGFRRGRQTPSMRMWGRDDDDETVTERHALGVQVDETTMLVLTALDARTTARLERIDVHFPGGERVGATFAGSLNDYGALVVRLDEPRSVAARLDRAPIERLGRRLLVSGEIELHGQNRVARFGHTRIPRFEHGWRRHVYPDMPGDTDNLFLFDTDGTLVALPVLARRGADAEERRFGRERPVLTAAAQLASVLDSPESHFDPTNVPLSEEEERRLAWLGVELQALDEELARLYEVSDETRDGSVGAIVSYVYDGSPAAEAGLLPGDLVLRLHTDQRPRPISIRAEDDPFAMWGGFPWDEYDEVPEMFYAEIPPPWPSADNAVNRALTELGFGSPVRLEVRRDGEPMMIEIGVVQGPAHHEAAARHRDSVIGLTLTELTYEVRRYFQKEPDSPGLVVTRVETGSRASVAGMKPYEIVTHVNDQPLHTAADLERLLSTQEDLRLNVERMHRTRIVRLTRPGEAAPEE